MMIRYRALAGLAVAALILWGVSPAQVQAQAQVQAPKDRHAGYYYPPPTSVEVYKARARILEEANRRRRIGFVIAAVGSMRERPYPPTFAIFPKGSEAQKLIIVSNQTGRLDTVYRVRALLATLTSVARTTPIFEEFAVQEIFTFLDLLKMLGFTQVTVSDGDTFTHQIKLE